MHSDGDIDLSTGMFSWIENTPSGKFIERVDVDDRSNYAQIHVIDLDQDGDQDLVGWTSSGDIDYRENVGPSEFRQFAGS